MTKALIASGVISQDLAKEQLDADFLEQLGTTPSAGLFTRKCIRLNTALNFKQTKFNLISEQSEGFSKLVVLVQATMATVVPHQISTDILRAVADNPGAECHGSAVIHALRSLKDLQQRIRCLLVDVNRLIGVFNIDPNRALDIILDCFMSNVRFYWAFYIVLLDASPWCQSPADSLKVAQLVDWRLQFYISGRSSDYGFMDKLTTMAALLITHRLVRLPDLHSILQPSTGEAIDKEYEAWLEKQKEQQLGDAGGLLAKMGGLDDMEEEGEDKHAAEEDSTDSPDRWENQHALLCAKLLSMGDTQGSLVYVKQSHPEAHQAERPRDDSVHDSTVEPPRQRMTTSKGKNSAQEASPTTASGAPGGSTLPPSTSLATRPSNEDSDRKRKELRAQLLKQQEEKQRQKEDLQAVVAPAERREQEGSVDSGRHSSSEQSGAGESKEDGGGRRDRRITSRLSGVNESPVQQQQQQTGGRDGGGVSNSSTFGRLGLSTQAHAMQTQGRQQQQQQSRRQAQSDNAAQSNYTDRNSRRSGRGADGNRAHSPPSRDDRHASIDEPASARIPSGRQAGKTEAGRSAGGNGGGGGGGTMQRKGAGDARQSGDNSDNNANWSRRGSKQGLGGGEWNGGKRSHR